MPMLFSILISGLLLFTSIVPSAQAAQLIKEGEVAPYQGFLFRRDELDKLQYLKDANDQCKEAYQKRITATGQDASPLKAALFSFIVPGTGQILYSEDKQTGKMMLAADVVLVAGVLYFSFDANSKFKRYGSSGEQSDLESANNSIAMRNGLMIPLAVLGVISALDAYDSAKKALMHFSLSTIGEKVVLNYRMAF